MADNNVLETVWGETSSLIPRDGADSTLARLHAVVAKLARIAINRHQDGQLRKEPAPRIGGVGEGIYQKLKLTIETIDKSGWSGAPLPERAMIWEITSTGAPRIDGSLPKAVIWIAENDVTSGGDFISGDGKDGRIYRLFETMKASVADELPFVSSVTGSGLPVLVDKNPYLRTAWVLGYVGVFLLIAGGVMAALSGRSMSGARNSLAATDSGYQYLFLEKTASICEKDYSAFPSNNQSAICDSLLHDHRMLEPDKETKKISWDLGQAKSVLDYARACPGNPAKDGCDKIWRAAVEIDQDQTWKKSWFGWLNAASGYLTGTSSSIGSTSILIPFLLTVLGLGGLVVALGLGTKRCITGVWIDTRNRVSLARAQVTLWTLVALSGYMALAMFNIGFAGILGTSADFASYQPFPGIPASVAAALGIATASTMLSALILPSKNKAGANTDFEIRGGETDLRKRGVPFFGAESQGLDTRPSPALASIADIFMGEEKANSETVDVARLQNVVITITLVLGFFSLLIGMMSSITAPAMLAAHGAVFTSLPELGATFTSLLLASHATYLVAKAHDAAGPVQGG